MQSNDSYLAVFAERLEDRRLMATTFSATEYFPLATGATWNYKTSIDSSTNLPTKRTMAAASVGGIAVTRVRDSTSHSGGTAIVDEFVTNNSKGLKSYQINFSGPEGVSGTIKQNTPVPIVPRTYADDGMVSEWTNLPVTTTLNVPSQGINGLVLNGTDTGSTISIGTPTVSGGANLAFLNASTLEVFRQQSYKTTISGQSVQILIGVAQSMTLARGVGVINNTFSVNVSISGLGFDEQVGSEQQFVSSSLVPTFTKVIGAQVRVGGTSGGDVITAGLVGSKIQVVRNDVAVSVPSAGITRIFIDAGAGNDTVGPITLGYIRATELGGDGNDNLVGGAGRDLLYGGAGKDTLVGGSGRDTLFGEAGNDILNGLNGADSINGGSGTDTAKLDNTDTRIAIEILV
ncbi:MAG: hypothetical protein H7144_16105 [Burkholderiales bacterium]|nr:hypothetical protein [Phycisphaerae bacterium]